MGQERKGERLKADAGGRGGGSAPAVALQSPWGCGGGCHRILAGLTGRFLSGLICPIRKSISRCTSLGVHLSVLLSLQETTQCRSAHGCLALLSVVLPRRCSCFLTAARDSYYGKSLHSCAEQSLGPTSSRISHDLVPNAVYASVCL